MIQYDPTLHEPLLTHWYYQLRAEPVEFANLFAEPLRNLTELLFWAKRAVKLGFAHDGAGIWGACWIEPYMTGAFFGCWIRKSHRGTLQAYGLVRSAQRAALERFPILIGITKQPKLDKVHRALGYEHLDGQIPFLFDGNAVLVYYLTREGFAHVGKRKEHDQQQRDAKPLRGGVVESGDEAVQRDPAGIDESVGKHRKRAANRQRKFKQSAYQPKRGRGKNVAEHVDGIDAASAGANGAGE